MAPQRLLLIFCLGCLAAPNVVTGDDEPHRHVEAPWRSVGSFYQNHFESMPKSLAIQRLKTLRAQNREISVREFLGGEVEQLVIRALPAGQSIEAPLGLSIEEAEKLLQEILDSVILSPQHPHRSPSLGVPWASSGPVTIAALIYYKVPYSSTGFFTGIGVLKTNGNYLMVQDNFGIYWWHRWNATFPRARIGTQDSGPPPE